jgi:hypothetical protein
MLDEPLNELGCKIFVNAVSPPRELAELISKALSLENSTGPVSTVIRDEVGEWELRRNEDRGTISERQFPDGFLHFPYVLEFYPRLGVKHEVEVDGVARLLEQLWAGGFPAVASCQYEDELRHQGGYGDASLPWPSGGLNGVVDSSSHAGNLGSHSRS